MGLLHRYILRQIWGPALLAAAVIGFIILAGEIQTKLKLLFLDVPNAEVNLWDIARISFYSSPLLIGYIFPITYLMGIMLTFGRMAQHSELTAMKSAGVPMRRIVMPVLVTGLILSTLTFVLIDRGQPWAYVRLTYMLTSDLPLRMSIDMLPTGRVQEYGRWGVYIGAKEEGGVLHNITVLERKEDGGATSYYAETARLAKHEGTSYLEMEQGYLFFEEQERKIAFDKISVPVPELQRRAVQSTQEGLTAGSLFRSQERLSQEFRATGNLRTGAELRMQRMEISNRFSFPLMCFAVAFVAAPLGARMKRTGRTYAFLNGLVIVGVYFTLRKVMEPMFIPTLTEAIVRGQIPNAVLLTIGSLLVWRVDRV